MIQLTEEELAILNAAESTGDESAAGEPGSVPEESQPGESQEAVTEPTEQPEGEEPVIKAKDGKHEIPFSVLQELREENKRLKQMLEELSTRLQPAQPQAAVPPEEERWVTDPKTGEKYLRLDKATEEELVTARAKALEEGDYRLVNSIDLEYQRRIAQQYTALSLYEASKAEFAARSHWFGKDPVLTRMAEETFIQLTKEPEWRNRPLREGWEEVERRLSRYIPVDREQLEKEILNKVMEQLKGQRTPTLAGIPGKAQESKPDKFAELDALLQKDPIAYERTLLKMSKEDYEEYRRRR
jgi:hypothetical protein